MMQNIDKFRTAIAQILSHNQCHAPPKIGLAVSGGPDSMALLSMMHHHYDGDIAAATVDHGLRSEAIDEAYHVANICAKLGVPHIILKPQSPITGNIQSSARNTRYALLHGWANDCAYIATAHHADDQLETMIMRINRGSGVAGLAGIRAQNGKIIRPLLNYRKNELIQWCENHAIHFINDPSNQNRDYDRVKVRQALAQRESDGNIPIFDSIMAQKTATNMNDAEIALQYSSNILTKTHIEKNDNAIIVTLSELPMEYQRRLLLIALKQIDENSNPRGQALTTLINRLKNNEISMISNVKCTPILDRNNPNIFICALSLAPPRNLKNG